MRDALGEQLDLMGEFAAQRLSTGAEALGAARAHKVDLILMDVGLPDLDGRDVCRALRRAGVKCPIILMAAVDSDADMILGLDSGANDYVVKPLRFGVLLARMRAQLRAFETSEDVVYEIGRFQFRPTLKSLNADGVSVRLTDKETAILKYLFRAHGAVIPRDVLLAEVWGYNSGVSTHTLETHVYRLRQKIEADPTHARILVTEGGGYKLVP